MSPSDDVISIKERGDTELDEKTWNSLRGEEALWALVDLKLVSVSFPHPSRARLRASSFVGTAKVGRHRLVLQPKIAGALEALLSYAQAGSFRVEDLQQQASEIGALFGLLVKQFLFSLQEYVGRGREGIYVREHAAGSLAGGRLDVTRTVRLRARGLGHRIAFDRPFISRATDENTILLAALLEVERLSLEAAPIDGNDIAQARSLATLFSDCMSPSLMIHPPSHFAERSRTLRFDGRTRNQDLLALAEVVLNRVSFDRAALLTGVVPRSWFINLEVLFEQAVRRTLAGVLGQLRVRSGTKDAAPIFEARTDVLTANPDVLIQDGSTTIAVGDVKYKDWSSKVWSSSSRAEERAGGGAPDLYQLLAHCAAYGSEKAFLVLPREEGLEVLDLGRSATGARTWVVGVDPRYLSDHLSKAMALMKIPPGEHLEAATTKPEQVGADGASP